MKAVISAMISLAIFGFAFADDKPMNYGVLSYGKENIDSIHANGVVKLDGTTVLKDLRVSGSVQAKNSTIGEMDVRGEVALMNCTVKKKSSIIGFLSAASTSFLEELSVTSQKVLLDSSSLSKLQIRKSPSFMSTQIVELRNRSKVDSITFESGQGKVVVDSTSSVGKVIGGQTEKQK